MGSWRLSAALLSLVLLASCGQEPPDQLMAAGDPAQPQQRLVIAAATRSVALAPVQLLATGPPLFTPPPTPYRTQVPTQPPSAPPPRTPRKPDPAPAGRPDCTKLKCVALTMDDGPVPATAKVLDLLKRKHVHVTFFVVGEMAKLHPGLVRRMVREGHVVGNHSWSHPEFFGEPAKALRSQLVRTDSIVRRATGHDPVLMRPPFGEVTSKVRSLSRKLGEAVVLWDVDPLDWKDRKASTVAKRVIRRAGRGSIILSHDSLKTTRKAYPRIIDGLRAKGFTLVTVPQLFAGKLKPGKVYARC